MLAAATRGIVQEGEEDPEEESVLAAATYHLMTDDSLSEMKIGGEFISTFKNVKISNPFNFAQTWNLGSSS